MFTDSQAINAAAAYVAEHDNVFAAAYNANRDATRGESASTVRQVLRNAVAGNGDQYNAVRTAASWLSESNHLSAAVQEGIREGTLPYGTSVTEARDFLRNALGTTQRQQPAVARVTPTAPRPSEMTEQTALVLAASRVAEDSGRFHRAFTAAQRNGLVPSSVSEGQARRFLQRAIANAR